MELSDLDYATRIASLLLSSFPNQAHDAKTFQKQLAIALTDRPKSSLKSLVDPRTGYLATAKFLTIADVIEWLDKHRPAVYSPARKQLAPPPEKPAPTAEQRARNDAMWQRTRRELQATALVMRSAFKKERRPSTTLTPDELAALERYIADPGTP